MKILTLRGSLGLAENETFSRNELKKHRAWSQC